MSNFWVACLNHFVLLVFFSSPENIRKPLVFWFFQGLWKDSSIMKQVNVWGKYSMVEFFLGGSFRYLRCTLGGQVHCCCWSCKEMSFTTFLRHRYRWTTFHISLNLWYWKENWWRIIRYHQEKLRPQAWSNCPVFCLVIIIACVGSTNRLLFSFILIHIN